MEFFDMRPKSLDYTEMCVLQIYRDWFGKKYNPEVAEKELIKQHESLQKIVYLFMTIDICIADFGFSWHDCGPKSTEFEYELKELDRKTKAINNFYKIDREYARENLFVYDNKKSRYEEVLEIIKTSCPEKISLPEWIDVVACLHYIKNVIGFDIFEEAAKQFVLRKYDVDKKTLKKAWQTKEELNNYNLVNYHKNDVNNKL